MIHRLAPLLVVLLALPTCGGESDPSETLEISAVAVEIGEGELDGLRLRGTVSLTSSASEFGGLSGIEISDGRLTSVTDRGWWLEADLAEADQGLVPVPTRFEPMRDSEGTEFDDAGADAEGLALQEGTFVIAFERDHRLMYRTPPGPIGGTLTDRQFETLELNKGLEALAALPDGSLLAIVEESRDGGHQMFRVARDGEIETARLPADDPFLVTGADLGPDGRLYVVLRDFSVLKGMRIRIHRYEMGADGFPMPQTRRMLASYRSAAGIDNMEGIALWTDNAGRLRLALVSDDNFNMLQRTLLMDFEVLD